MGNQSTAVFSQPLHPQDFLETGTRRALKAQALQMARGLRQGTAPTLDELLESAERIYEWLVQ
jgi:hypothetical protein